MIASHWTPFRRRVESLWPGILVSGVVAAAAAFLSEHYGAPVMLLALLLGMSMNFVSAEGRCQAGIEFASRQVLRIGVGLLGLRITFEQVMALGWQPVLMVVATVTVTIVVSVAVARAVGFNPLFGLLTGGATSICGASAAMALSAALPAHPEKERATAFTVVGVSALSTIAMVLYPMIVKWLDLNDVQAGIFLGGTIHDVAQVVGAGYSMSPVTGDVATVVKLMRVAMLLPVIVCAAMIARHGDSQAVAEGGGKRPPLLPWFAVLFVVLAALNSAGWVPTLLESSGNELSRWCLVTAISALGLKTRLGELADVGFKPVALMLAETVFLAALVILALRMG